MFRLVRIWEPGKRWATTLVIAMTLVQSACGGSKDATAPGSREPSALALVTAPPPTARSGIPFTTQPVVQLRDSRGHAVSRSGVLVHARADGGPVTVGGDTVVATGGDGRAVFTALQMFGVVGARGVAFESTGLEGAKANLTLLPGAATRMTADAGDGQFGQPGTAVAIRPSVKITDDAGNGIPGAAVTFAVASGGGSVAGSTQTTASTGIATVERWTLGATPALNALIARAAGTSDLSTTFVATTMQLRFTSLAQSGYNATCALTADGAAYCWGSDIHGQLGIDRPVDHVNPERILPTPVSGNLRFSEISLSGGSACGLAITGAAFCWGGSEDGSSTQPAAVPGGLTFTSLSVSGHRCALTADGTAYCWGSNDAGQLGTGDRVDRPGPSAVAGGLHFTRISTGQYQTCAIATDGIVYCWGDPYNTGSISELILTPRAISGTLKFASIDAGFGYACGVATDAEAYCWGVGYDGRLGDGMSHLSREPSPVAGGLSFASVSTGDFACGLTTAGAVYCWGGGYLGAGPPSQSSVPVPIAGGLSFTSVNVANAHACALSTGGRVYCWGANDHGQLGDGTRNVSYVPVAVLGQL